MRYRLMASYLGASYQAAVGPSDRDVTLFAAPPPPEEHGFSPAPGGIWRKQVRLDELGALWESRPIGSYHGEPCLVLDDLGDRLHVVYLGMDERRAAQLGYWEVDRGVFEVVVPRYEVTDLAEERHEFPIALLLSTLPAPSPRALGSGDSVPAGPGPSRPVQLGVGPNGAGMRPQGNGRAIGAIGPGSAAGPGGAVRSAAVTGGMGAAAAGQGPGGPMEWRGPQPGGQQLPGGPQGAGLPGVPAGQLAAVAPGPNGQGSPGARQAPGPAPLPAPAMQLPPGRQLPAAQPPAPQQQPQQQQFPPAPPLPAAPQAVAVPQPAPVQQAAAPQPGSTQAPQAQAPTAMAAWHGSPVAGGNGNGNGNGTWYFQPAPDQQHNGAPTAGYAPNGLAPNGYAQQDQGTAQASSPNGFGGMQQYAQPAQPAPVTGYQQAPTAIAAQQPQPGQPGMPGQHSQPPQAVQLTQAAQPAQALWGPQFAVSSAPQAPAAAMGAPTALPGPVTTPPTTQTGPVTVPLAVPAPVAPPPVTLQQQVAPQPVAPQQMAPQPLSAPLPTTAAPSEASASSPLTSLPPAPQTDQGAHSGLTAGGALSKLTGAVRGRRAARKPRLAMSAIFADLVDMADIPRAAYSVDEEITGAMCLFKTDGGYEVFSCAEDARHEVRFFEEEEAAYFYLFGVLAAEALRSGRLSPRRG